SSASSSGGRFATGSGGRFLRSAFRSGGSFQRTSHRMSASIYGGRRSPLDAFLGTPLPRQLERVGHSPTFSMASNKSGSFELLDSAADEAGTDAKRNQLPMRSLELAVVLAAVTKKFPHQEHKNPPCGRTERGRCH